MYMYLRKFNNISEYIIHYKILYFGRCDAYIFNNSFVVRYTKLDHDFTRRFMAFSFDGINKMENLSDHVIFRVFKYFTLMFHGMDFEKQ